MPDQSEIQEVNQIIARARIAQNEYEKYGSQEKYDNAAQAVGLYYYSTPLLFTTLLPRYSTTLLLYYPAARLPYYFTNYYRTTMLLYYPHSYTSLLHYFSTATLLDYSIIILLCNSTTRVF